MLFSIVPLHRRHRHCHQRSIYVFRVQWHTVRDRRMCHLHLVAFKKQSNKGCDPRAFERNFFILSLRVLRSRIVASTSYLVLSSFDTSFPLYNFILAPWWSVRLSFFLACRICLTHAIWEDTDMELWSLKISLLSYNWLPYFHHHHYAYC